MADKHVTNGSVVKRAKADVGQKELRNSRRGVGSGQRCLRTAAPECYVFLNSHREEALRSLSCLVIFILSEPLGLSLTFFFMSLNSTSTADQ